MGNLSCKCGEDKEDDAGILVENVGKRKVEKQESAFQEEVIDSKLYYDNIAELPISQAVISI